jgi:hypothetical protein
MRSAIFINSSTCNLGKAHSQDLGDNPYISHLIDI